MVLCVNTWNLKNKKNTQVHKKTSGNGRTSRPGFRITCCSHCSHFAHHFAAFVQQLSILYRLVVHCVSRCFFFVRLPGNPKSSMARSYLGLPFFSLINACQSYMLFTFVFPVALVKIFFHLLHFRIITLSVLNYRAKHAEICRERGHETLNCEAAHPP